MKICLRDQTHNLPKHLERLQKSRVMEYSKTKLVEKISVIDLQTEASIDTADLRVLFNYKIFPEHILSALTAWKNENRQMRVGDTIVQQACFPPAKVFSMKLIFGVRICAVIDEGQKKGFSYETLDGHVEKGISTFTVEQTNDKLIFKIHTFSRPGNLLTRFFAPVFTIPYQAFCTKAALRNVRKAMHNT